MDHSDKADDGNNSFQENVEDNNQNANVSTTTTDSSDIEIIGEWEDKDSSDSIEVLSGDNCALGRRDTVVECTDDANVDGDGSETTDGDTEHVDLDQLQLDDQTPAQETAAQFHTQSCNVDREIEGSEPLDSNDSTSDTTSKVLEKSHSHDKSGYASDSSFSRGGSYGGSDVEHLLGTDNLSDSSGYTDDHAPNQFSPFGSPVHGASNVDSQMANGSVINRPDSLSLPRPLQFYERQRLSKKDSSSSISSYSSRSSSMDALIEVASSTPLRSQGKVTRDGDMVAFVNDSLQEMIKRSSPLTKSGSQTPSARSVSSMSSSTSGWSVSNSSVSGYSYSGLSRSPSIMNQSPEDIPPIDPKAVADLEAHAKRVAESLDDMMINLKTNLHKMSSITYSCVDAYKDGVDGTCDSVDASIKAMYALMAKCEELSKATRPIYQLHEQIKEIKRLLDMFEAQMARDEK